MAMITRRQEFLQLRAALTTERVPFIPLWRDVAEYILPRRVQFNLTDVNKGDRRNLKILDSTATLAAGTLRSGMMGGITSPARPWFRLSTADMASGEIEAVKIWLDVVSKRMTAIFLRSNLYNALPLIYGDMGVFGIGAMMVEEDFDDVMRCYVFPVGTYMIGLNDKRQVDVFLREFSLTVRQVVQKFGNKNEKGEIDWSVFSSTVKNYHDMKQMDFWINICHVIRPNPDYNPAKLTSKKYESVYFESGQVGNNISISTTSSQNEGVYLRDSGYDYFPVLCPRWETTGEDVYGTEFPGVVALGDVKQLQLGEKRILQAIEKSINPPMVAPSNLRMSKTSILPGDITYVDEREGQKGFRPAHEVRPAIQDLEFKQEQIRKRISRAFKEDLFLMLATSDRRQITAREIDERHEEKLIALGPVLEQLNQDLLDPLIDIAFELMLKQGLIPEPPPELQGVKLKIEYISIMHQAQKLAGLSSIERLAGFVGQMAQFDPSVLDKIDRDQMIDEYADIIGVPPKIVVSDDKVQEMRAQKAQAAQAQIQSQQMANTAKTAKDLSAAKLDGNSALSALLRQSAAGQAVPQ